jgi:hypothetical protein
MNFDVALSRLADRRAGDASVPAPAAQYQWISTFDTGASLIPSKTLFEKLLYLEA